MWNTYDEVRKRVYVGQMILAVSDELDKGNPTRFIWTPQGCVDEVKQFWTEELSKSTIVYKGDKVLLNPNHERWPIYFPEMREDEQSVLPGLFTAKDEHRVYLRQYFLHIFKYSRREQDLLKNINLEDISALEAFHMVGEVLLPAYKRQSEEETPVKKESLPEPGS